MPIHSRPVLATPHPYAELDRLGEEIAELSAHLDAATARFLALIREFDARGGWNTGFRSCAAWLSWRVGLDLGAAREQVRVARALGALPLLAEALARGQLSYAKVRALTRVATPETEARLLAVGRAGTAAHVERIVRGWRRVDRQAEAREAARQHAGRALHVYQDDDGTVVLRGRLAPEVGALLLRALDAARETLYQRARATAGGGAAASDPATEPPTRAQQQADALALLAETALHHELDPGAPGERYQVVVHVDAAVLADPEQPGQSVLEEGSHVSAETSRRLACDASRVVMRHDHTGRLAEVGARTRTIPPALRRALLHRDPNCRFPGCHVRVGQGHHVRHWAQGGPTTLTNLVLLCRRHHRAVHEEGYQVARGPEGTLRFRRPDGRPLPEVPPAAAVPADPVATLHAQHASQGLRLHARTACPGWLGERLDVGWAIDVLHPRAVGAPVPAPRLECLPEPRNNPETSTSPSRSAQEDSMEQETRKPVGPRERVTAAYKGQFADRVPAYPIAGVFAGCLDGLSIEEYCTDPTRASRAMLNYYERFQPDIMIAFNDLAKEAEAIGCHVKYSDYVVPSIDQHVLQDDKGKLARLEVPDPRRDGRLPAFLEQCTALSKAGLPCPLGSVNVGPWTIAMLMRNPELMCLDTIDDPEFVHELMRFATEYAKRVGDAVLETRIGLSYSDPTASCSLVGPETYREFIKPYHKDLVDYFKAKKVGTTVHICGTTHQIHEDLMDVGFVAVTIDLDQQGDPALKVDQLDRLVTLGNQRGVVGIGNVDVTIFERATQAEIEAEVRRCIDTVGPRSRFVLSTSCELPPQANPDCVRWFMEAAREYGRYERILAG